jgi:antitoxin component of RelBE/YafQ-DinJ toxin-antitoxin module
MEDKPARLTVLIDAEKKKAFEDLCAAQDITASQAIRQLIREYLARHGVQYARAIGQRVQ